MPRMTADNVASDLRGLAELAESVAEESVVCHVAFGRMLEAKAFEHAASVVSEHLVPRWHVPDQEGWHWLEELPEDSGPKLLRRHVVSDRWHQFEWWNGGGWVRVTKRVCRVSGRPGA